MSEVRAMPKMSFDFVQVIVDLKQIFKLQAPNLTFDLGYKHAALAYLLDAGT